jgi:hypothetical protein
MTVQELEFDEVYYRVYENKHYYMGRFQRRMVLDTWAEVEFKHYDGTFGESGNDVLTATYRLATRKEKFLLWLKGELPQSIYR